MFDRLHTRLTVSLLHEGVLLRPVVNKSMPLFMPKHSQVADSILTGRACHAPTVCAILLLLIFTTDDSAYALLRSRMTAQLCFPTAMLTAQPDFCLHMQVNVVVMRGVNDDEIADFVELTRDHAINIRFIEYMPFDGNVWSDTKMVTYKQMMAAVQQQFPDGLQRMQVIVTPCSVVNFLANKIFVRWSGQSLHGAASTCVCYSG